MQKLTLIPKFATGTRGALTFNEFDDAISPDLNILEGDSLAGRYEFVCVIESQGYVDA